MTTMSYVEVHRASRMEATSTTVTADELATVLLDRIEDDTGRRPLGTHVEVERKVVLDVAILTVRWSPPARVGRTARWDVAEDRWV